MQPQPIKRCDLNNAPEGLYFIENEDVTLREMWDVVSCRELRNVKCRRIALITKNPAGFQGDIYTITIRSDGLSIVETWDAINRDIINYDSSHESHIISELFFGDSYPDVCVKVQ